MVRIEEVKTRKQRKEFLDFPIKLFKDNPSFVPPLYMDEKKIFSKDYPYYNTCEAVYYNAYNETGKMVGRISGIIQNASNIKHGERRVRFTRFDCIEDRNVAQALFKAVEDWGRERRMEYICGPLGFSDLEREGLLVEGFDEPETYEEQYNPEYYKDFIESFGFEKEIDWTESQLSAPSKPDETLHEMSAYIMEKYKLHFAEARNIKQFLKKYSDSIFELIDKSYASLYGTVPIDAGVKKLALDNFKLLLTMRYIAVILDENEKAICFGFCVPSLSKASKASNGRITPAFLYHFLKAKYMPEILDLCLIGVDFEWMRRGVSTIIASEFVKFLQTGRVKYTETNLNLEDNHAINNLWKRFDRRIHKRRRSYLKKL